LRDALPSDPGGAAMLLGFVAGVLFAWLSAGAALAVFWVLDDRDERMAAPHDDIAEVAGEELLRDWREGNG
jgi:hypothetical protein